MYTFIRQRDPFAHQTFLDVGYIHTNDWTFWRWPSNKRLFQQRSNNGTELLLKNYTTDVISNR